jgi:anti-sigma-K factor RskA
MSLREDQTWSALLAKGAPAFAGETEPPFGLATRVLASARRQQSQQDASERLGLRAIFASLAMVAVAAALTASLHFGADRDDTDPVIRSLAVAENVQVS